MIKMIYLLWAIHPGHEYWHHITTSIAPITERECFNEAATRVYWRFVGISGSEKTVAVGCFPKGYNPAKMGPG